MATSRYQYPNTNMQYLEGSAAGKWDNDRGLDVYQIYNTVSSQVDTVNAKLSALRNAGSSISITDMFEMQMKMNRLSQLSEMATAMVSASGAAIQSIARNVK